MKKRLALLLTALLLLSALPALAEGTRIQTLGNATIYTEPDMVSVYVSVSARDDTLAKAQQTVSEIVAELKAALIESGLTEADIVTNDYSLTSVMDYETYTVTGYQAHHSLTLKVSDITKLDHVVNIVSDKRVSDMYAIDFGITNRAELYRQALANALHVAEEKALVLAKAAGYESVTLVDVIENSSYSAYANTATYAVESAAAGKLDVSTGINAGSISVNATVTATFEAE